jgi:acetylornithine deacetylase
MEAIPGAPFGSLAPEDILLALCERDTTSGQEAALLPVLLPVLEGMGARVDVREFAPGRCNVLATWGEPGVLLSTHLDTVPPYLPPRRDGDGIAGRGACDAKGQLVAQLMAVSALRERGVAWLGVAGEETDSLGAREALAWKDRFATCKALINGEPTELKIASGQRGVRNLRLACRGVAAHGGSPERGHSALLDLMDWIHAARALPLARDPDLGPEVWNLGLLRGGEAVNMVPDRAEARINLRWVPGSSFCDELQALRPPGGSLTVELDEPPCHFPAVPGFLRAAVPFGSDAPALGALIPDGKVVLAGPGSITVAHTPEERLAFADLREGAGLFFRLARHILDQDSGAPGPGC